MKNAALKTYEVSVAIAHEYEGVIGGQIHGHVVLGEHIFDAIDQVFKMYNSRGLVAYLTEVKASQKGGK